MGHGGTRHINMFLKINRRNHCVRKRVCPVLVYPWSTSGTMDKKQ
jgi:hypothetical protein